MYSLEVIRKNIKHIYFRVDPEKKKIRVSVPFHVDPETINSVISSKSDWLHRQINSAVTVKIQTPKQYVTGDLLLFKGREYVLHVNHHGSRSKVLVKGDNRICLTVRPNQDAGGREKIVTNWYRKQLKQSIGKIIIRWQPFIGVTVNEFGVKKMRTRWGSCNIRDRRIWLNFVLIKFAEPFLEYVVVHEMVHLLERRHSVRFKGFMDQFIPDWRSLKREMDMFRL